MWRNREIYLAGSALSAAVLAVCVLGWGMGPASSDTVVPQDSALVIRNDRGGNLRERIALLETLRRQGRRAEIGGAECLSACTLYLGLPGSCVHRRTVFGFHGPSHYGAPLPPGQFEFWSRQIADQYPEPLRSWYLETGRTRIAGFFRLSGAVLVQIGIPPC